MSSPEPLLLKFAKTIYESPLILLLCGSAVVSAAMGNIDDAVSITVAILIVLTGKSCTTLIGATLTPSLQLGLSKSEDQRKVSKH